MAGSLPSNSGSEVSIPCQETEIPRDVWHNQKKISFFNWTIVKCLEKKGKRHTHRARNNNILLGRNYANYRQQSDSVKLQKKIKNLPCPPAWSSIACQKHFSKMKAKRTSKKQNQRESLPSGNIEGSLGTVGEHSGNERFWKWWMHGWIWKIFFILKFFKKVMNCLKTKVMTVYFGLRST